MMYIVIKLLLTVCLLECLQCTCENNQYKTAIDHENNREYSYIDNYLWHVAIRIKDKPIRDEIWKYGSLIRRTIVLTHIKNIIGFTADNLTIIRDCQWINPDTSTDPNCNIRNVMNINNQKSLNFAILFIESAFDNDELSINKRVINSVKNEKILLYTYYINTLKLAKQTDIINSNNCFTSSWVKKSLSNNKQGFVRVSTSMKILNTLDDVKSMVDQNNLNILYAMQISNPNVTKKLNYPMDSNNSVQAFIGSPIVCQLKQYPLRYVQIGIESGGFNIFATNDKNGKKNIIGLGRYFIKTNDLQKIINQIIKGKMIY